MRILFMGTPEFAAVSLRRLIDENYEVCGVFTQPDKPRNRGKVTFSPVKETALSHEIPVFQPSRMKDGEALSIVNSLAPDLIAVAAYGKILPEEILRVPPYGCVNVHASLLPAYRGAAPINWAILHGETETGITMMHMAKELDAGDIILQKTLPIDPEENAQELTARLAALGAAALIETVEALRNGTAGRTPQDESRKSYAPMLSRELSDIDWSRSAHEIHCQVRGLIPWPCAATTAINGEVMKLYRVSETGEESSAAPGSVVAAGKTGIDLACGDRKVLRVTELQAQGGKRMSAAAYLLGHPVQVP